MDSSKKIRALFVKVDDSVPQPTVFYGITINGRTVQNISVGMPDGAIEVAPAPGPGENPFRKETIVSLTPRPNVRYELKSWGGDCGGTGSCVLTMNKHKEVAVSFQKKSFRLVMSASEGGTVSPSGATSHEFDFSVIVTFQPTDGYEFTGWSGACSGTGQCSVRMDQDRSVTAHFARIQTPTPAPTVPPTSTPTPTPSP